MWTPTLCRESHFQLPQNWGNYSTTNIGKIAIHVFILQVCKHSHDSDVLNNFVCRCFDQSELGSGLIVECIHLSHILCKVYQSCHSRGSLLDLVITQDRRGQSTSWHFILKIRCTPNKFYNHPKFNTTLYTHVKH